MIFTTLKVVESEVSQRPPSKTAAEQDGNNRAVSLAFERFSVHNARASLADNQFPSRIPSFFAPLTRRIPAASSGLSKPASAASYANRRIAASRTLIVPGAKLRDSSCIR